MSRRDLCSDPLCLPLAPRGQGNSPQAQNLARQLAYKLHQLKNNIQGALVDRVVEDFCDITSPLKQFTEAVLAPEGDLD